MAAFSSHSLILTNDLHEISRLTAFIEAFGETFQLPSDTIFYLTLAMEELTVNVIQYAWEDDGSHDLHIRISLDQNEVTAEVQDDGKPFNPVEETPIFDIEAIVEHRPVGGLGVHLVKKLMDTVEYLRENNQNIIRIHKSLAPIPFQG